MTQFEWSKAGNTQAREQQGNTWMFEQITTGRAKTGVVSGLAVVANSTPNGTVLVNGGAGVVQESVTAGAGLLSSDAVETVDVFTANPVGALPRYDIVVFDRALVPNGIRVIVGTPNASPSDPTVPSTAIPLCRLRHAANATTIQNSAIDDLRDYVRRGGEPLPVADATARNALSKYVGRQVYRLDLNLIETWNGTAWMGGAWIAYTPAIGGGGWSLGNGTASGWYMLAGRTVTFIAQVGWGSTSTFGGSQLTIGLPLLSAAGKVVTLGSAHAIDDSASQRYDAKGVILASSTTVSMFTVGVLTGGKLGAVTTGSPFSWATQDVMYVAGTYEAA